MDFSTLKKQILMDVKVKLSEEFDRNFERKAFFTKKWKERKKEGRGTLMVVSGNLRRSLRAVVDGNSVRWTSNMPYASIHNEGGTIEKKASKKVLHFNKKGKFAKANKKAHYAQQANVGAHKITMPQRQFIGDSPEVRAMVTKIIENNMKELENYITQILKEGKK